MQDSRAHAVKLDDSAVSEIVHGAVAASGAAMADHYLRQAKRSGNNLIDLASELDAGYQLDLEDAAPEGLRQIHEFAFDHQLTSQAFRKKFEETAEIPGNAGAADESRQYYSLFAGSDVPAGVNSTWRNRTRISAILQTALREARHARSPSHTRAREPAVTIPSPLHIAAKILSDPKSPSSSIAVEAALTELLKENVAALSIAKGREFDLSYDEVTNALKLVGNRASQRKPISANITQNGPVVLAVCHYLAMKGQLFLRMNVDEISLHSLQHTTWEILLGERSDAGASFWANPQYQEYPDAGELLNALVGVPIPIQGAQTVFCGGLRLSQDKSAVIALSGPYGGGKTSICLSLSSALATVGCRVLYLSFEEEQSDLELRLQEAAKNDLQTSTRLFNSVDPEACFTKEGISSWFLARRISVSNHKASDDGEIDNTEEFESLPQPAEELPFLIQTLTEAQLFEPFLTEPERTGNPRLPSFARPVIILDGLHHIFQLEHDPDGLETALNQLVEVCRSSKSIVILTFSEENRHLRRLDYLCDVVLELDREGFERRGESPTRILKLLKSRRQPSRPGAHVFHLHGTDGFKISPRLSARTNEYKRRKWAEFDGRSYMPIGDQIVDSRERSVPHEVHDPSSRQPLMVRSGSQVLVVGKGSSGKAGFGLYLLHRRKRKDLSAQRRAQLDLFQSINSNSLAAGQTERLMEESRVLVISFLYQDDYYSDLTSRLTRQSSELFSDRLYTETISLHPGLLGVEDFLSRIDERLSSAEIRGLPFTGILLDGIHNVFVQFPGLESQSQFWPELFSILRRRALTLVTTHTKFSLSTSDSDSRRWNTAGLSISQLLEIDFQQAQRQSAPLLSALVSAADYVFDLSETSVNAKSIYQLTLLTALGPEPERRQLTWDRQRLMISQNIR